MNINDTLINNYIEQFDEVSIPQLQCEFSLDYKTAREIFAKLEKSGKITLKEGIVFSVKKSEKKAMPAGRTVKAIRYPDGIVRTITPDLKRLKTEIELRTPNHRKAVYECAISETMTVALLQRQVGVSYHYASYLFDWLVASGVLEKQNDQTAISLIDEDDYIAMFGAFETEEDKTPDALRELQRIKDILFADDDDSDDDEEDDDEEENEEDDDNYEVFNAENEAFRESCFKFIKEFARDDPNLRRADAVKILNDRIMRHQYKDEEEKSLLRKMRIEFQFSTDKEFESMKKVALG